MPQNSEFMRRDEIYTFLPLDGAEVCSENVKMFKMLETV